jgi:hypothetical protein
MITIHDVANYFSRNGFVVEKIWSDKAVLKTSNGCYFQILLADNRLSLYVLGVTDKATKHDLSVLLRNALSDILADNLVTEAKSSGIDRDAIVKTLKAMSYLNGRDGFIAKRISVDIITLLHVDSGVEYTVKVGSDSFIVRVISWSDSDWYAEVLAVEEVTDSIVSMLLDEVDISGGNILRGNKEKVLNNLHRLLTASVVF